jgi:hypothetical protein
MFFQENTFSSEATVNLWMMSHPKRRHSSQPPLRKPQISYNRDFISGTAGREGGGVYLTKKFHPMLKFTMCKIYVYNSFLLLGMGLRSGSR